MTDSPLSGRIALITGASGGIGNCIARGLAESGIDLFLTYARHGDDAEEVGEYARGLGRRAVVASADLADPAAPVSLVGQANRELGGIDILIANAGTATVRGWQNTDLELWNTTLAINLTAPFPCPARTAGHDRTALRPRAVRLVDRGAERRRRRSSLRRKQSWPARTDAPPGSTGGGRRRHRQCSGACTGRRHPDVSRRSGDRNRSVPIPVGRVGRPDEVADMAIAMLRNGYLTNKVVTLDGGILPR